jgi:hypothetical protein
LERARIRTYIHTNYGAASEDLPLTNTDRDVELGDDFPNCIFYAHIRKGGAFEIIKVSLQ